MPSPCSPDPTKFVVKHGSDKQAYTILDHEKGTLKPLAVPIISDQPEPVLTLAEAIGSKGDTVESQIERAKQIVFHAAGDTGNTRGPHDEALVSDKMAADFDDPDPRSVPSFLFHLGDVVYSFGEDQYYYDQFYDMFRDYPAPIFAIPGNHDGMVAPNSSTPTLKAFLENFCAVGEKPHRTPEAGELVRTAQIQPSVFFTLEAPFVRILGLYSNCLEDSGIISTQGNRDYSQVTDAQLAYLKAALEHCKDYDGAVIIAVHHPPYVALTGNHARGKDAGKHGGSPAMLADIDSACESAGVWPHAVLSGHAHNYQRFTRHKDDRETPFLVCGNSGHAVSRLTHKGTPTIRVPVDQTRGKDVRNLRELRRPGFRLSAVDRQQRSTADRVSPCP